jgi:hypothetical protein
MKQQHYPTGWNEERVRKLLLHYERQTEEEAVAEDEATLRRRDQTVMVVPKRLVPTITRMIAKAGQREQSSPCRPNKRATPHRRPVAASAKPERTRAARGDRQR